MIIAVGKMNFVEAAAAIGGAVGIDVHDIEGVGVLGIGDDVHVVPGPLDEAVVGIDELPSVAAVVGAIEAAFGSFDQGVDAVRVRANGNTDAAVGTFRQPLPFEMLPGGATVVGTVEAATRAAAVELPGGAADLPERCEQDVGIAGIEGEIDTAAVFILVEDLVPGLTAVGGAEDAPFGIGSEGMAECGNEGYVGV